MKWKNKGHEFDSIKNIIISDENKYYIFGAGLEGLVFYNFFKDKIVISGFIDNDPNKQKKTIDNLPVLSPLNTSMDDYKIIIATGYTEEIAVQLNQIGLQRNKDFFDLEFFAVIFYWYKFKKVYFQEIGVISNTVCSLKCKYCVGLIPYSKNKYNISFEAFKKEIDALFKCVDYVGIVSISGGDAILNPELSKFISYLGDNYSNHFSQIQLYTNAVIMPDNDLLKILKRYSIIIRVSDYGKNVCDKQQINKLSYLLENEKIELRVVQFNHWINPGYIPNFESYPKFASLESIITHFDECNPVLCKTLYNGRLFQCSPSAYGEASGLFPNNESDSFNLLQNEGLNKASLCEFYLGYSEKGFPSLCAKCKGLFNIDTTPIPVAEQI